MESKAINVEFGIAEELSKIEQLANELEQQGKELFKAQEKATQLLKQANTLLQPIGNFQETMVESALSDLKKAGMENSQAYKELASSYDYLDRINSTVKRMSKDVSRALN